MATTCVYEHIENYSITVSLMKNVGTIKIIMLAHLLVSEYVYEVEERERSGLKN